VARPVRRVERLGRQVERGEIGTAILCRLPVTGVRAAPLELLPRDHAARSVLLQTVHVGAVAAEVAGTHMAHLSQGSLRHFAAVRALLGEDSGRPHLLLGDLNLWGTVVERVLPGWRRAVRGRSWPAPLPVAQPDHVLVRGPLTVVEGRVLPPVGSDHRPVRAVVRLASS
jgi:endonuclease/exonuclease/phosphatase family metal-dependent hydrolase